MKFKLRRPTNETLFHVDWSWFERNNLDPQSVIRNQLTESCRQRYEGREVAEVDHIDPVTGEVFRLDNLREAILAECQWEDDYLSRDLPLGTGHFAHLPCYQQPAAHPD